MKKSIVLFSLLFIITSFLQAKKILLTEAVEKGYVEILAEGEGGHSGKCLKLKIKNLFHLEIWAGSSIHMLISTLALGLLYYF